jgi:hypothetical protein
MTTILNKARSMGNQLGQEYQGRGRQIYRY